ncbi:LytR/AlgR family response regulator transcription factor [Chitinophaga nivalis]|uniref:LytTR family DNA-binding domain-containing protein n=1 Tax=Chitinophaga nivalis TaxID=2991709 RepID=A0ABT3IGZ9_9BACT|nr:LytTR family DNA-binding domain-containing protein [Chitinophaga nivalis]MCW3467061.1 LytTR family DNA-binding domain-containing protein [Chitinophaga nivalis]MCW3483248.1 LytTR family DNA-binding domain-containing protein [Chitinophaga nivalis]
MNITCMIVDDEPLAREGLQLLIQDAGILRLAAVCSNVMEASQVLGQQKIDLMFLDIEMPKIRGIDFLRGLTIKPLVVITTAYPNFALEGFELNVLDYLVKPITPERFLRAVNRAREWLQSKEETQPAATEFFFIKCSHGYEKITYQDILFIEGSQNYVTIYTRHQKFLTLTTMKSIEEQLPAGKFLRIQKSFIVAVDKIQSFSGNEITIDTHKIPVSRNYKDELMLLIDKHLIKR